MSDAQSHRKNRLNQKDLHKQPDSFSGDGHPATHPMEDPEFTEASREEILLLQLMEKNTQLQLFQGKISKLQHDFDIAEQIINCFPQSVFFIDNKQHILNVNSSFCEMTGYSTEELKQKMFYQLVTLKDSGLDLDQLLQRTSYMQGWRGKVLLKKKDNSPGWYTLSLRYIDRQENSSGQAGYICQLSKTTLKESENLKNLPPADFNHDSLTGLPDRASSQRYLANCIEKAKKDGSLVGLIHIDIDHFKRINRLFGASFGDELLNRLSSILQHCANESGSNFTGRLSGDEFIIILFPLTSEEQADICINQVLKKSRFPASIHSRDIFFSLSIGLALFPHDGESPTELLHNADTAMTLAKTEKGNSSYRWTRTIEKSSTRKLTLENDLHTSLKNGELRNYFQPQINLITGVIVGLEALMRWEHPEHGTISPNIFIPLAENTGLINDITRKLIRDACMQGKKWMNMGFKDFTIAVNISGTVLQGNDLFEQISEALNSTGFPATALELELTETVLIENTDQISTFIRRCQQEGIHITIDDFGIGYSSLSHLQRFAVDKIKIDRSFITGVPKKENDAALTLAIIAMSKELNIRVLAEGVENEGQLAFLQKNRCDECQGFLFSKPIPAARMTHILKHDSCIAMRHRRIISKFFSIKAHHTLPGHIAKVN